MTRKLKKRTYSTGSEWDGFGPAAYTLGQGVWKLPIDRLVMDHSGEGDAVTRMPTTVGDTFKLYNGWLREEDGRTIKVEGKPIGEIESDSGLGEEGEGIISVLTVKTSSGVERYSGSGFSVELLETLLRLRKAGTNPFTASWFFFDADHVRDDLHARYTFFVVQGDKIVEEHVSFSDYPGNGFDPAVLSTGDEYPPIWLGEEGRHEALVRLWYRKFYAETRTGQLMVLNPDKPDLYFYPEGRFTSARLEGVLEKTNSLLWALLVIGLLILIRLFSRG